MRSPFTASLALLVLALLISTSLAQLHHLPRLSKFVSHYEPLTYDTLASGPNNQRARRSTQGSTQSLHFEAYGRQFKLRIKRDTDYVFSDDLEVVSSDGSKIDLNLDHIYSGHLDDVPNSNVYGQVTDGIFEGRIHTPQETWYVERSFRYRNETSSPSFHSIIYPSSAVNHPILEKHLGSGCAFDLDPKISRWMDSIAQSAVPGSEEKEDAKSTHTVTKRSPQNIYPRTHPGFSQSSRDHPKEENIWTRNAQSRISNERKEFYPQSHIALAPYGPSTVKKRTCSLYIQTDTYLWEHIRKDATTDAKAREEIASLVSQHIKAVNHIYENSDFNGIRGLKFIVQRLRINDSSTCDTQTKRDHNPFCSPNIDVSNFLNLNSQFNHNDFCLAYIFTYRDFSGGTLGLAWVASTSGASGGICEKYKSYTENIHGRQVQTKRSLNTGIITFVNYNSRVPPKVSELTLAHEIGHNFGSPHDYPLDCRPGGTQGNYIMYSSATSGERPNNNKFSPCSIRNISAVLQAVFNTEGKENCFQEDNGPFCGNKIVEENEECDCGYDSKECTEQCCYPHEIEPFLQEDPTAKPCTRRRAIMNAVCSPSEGPCCSDKCKYEPSHKLCRHETECTHQSSCNGFKATCPPGDPKMDKTECNGGTQVCWNGSCVGSICQKYGMEECFLTSRSGANPDEMCEVACQRATDVHTCQRTSKLPEMKNISGLKLRPGSPCNDFQGYCDVFQRCRAVDAEGPLAMLKNLLFNQYTLMTIKSYATTYWWVCMLIGVAVIVFMAAFIKCCAVHTPSSNPKRKKALRISDTLRRPADTLRRKRHRPGTRPHHSQVPSNAAIPLQPSAPLPQESVATAPTQYSQSQGTNYQVHQQSTSFNALQMQQNQLVVALPPEQRNSNSGAVNVASNQFLLEPPPPYPGPVNSSGLNASGHLPLPPRPSVNRSAGSSSNAITNASAVIAGPSHGYGEGRGHYNRRSGQATAFPAPPVSSSAQGKSVPLAMPNSSKTAKSALR